jgi:hypothetical protein
MKQYIHSLIYYILIANSKHFVHYVKKVIAHTCIKEFILLSLNKYLLIYLCS